MIAYSSAFSSEIFPGLRNTKIALADGVTENVTVSQPVGAISLACSSITAYLTAAGRAEPRCEAAVLDRQRRRPDDLLFVKTLCDPVPSNFHSSPLFYVLKSV